jgi:hypothetical protein
MGPLDQNYGTVAQENGTLRLSFAVEDRDNERRELADELIPIAWGERKYLVPTEEIIAFCNMVNGGFEPRTDVHGLSLLREGDERKDVTRLPAVPRRFKPYLLSKPIETEITGVGEPTTTSSNGDIQNVAIPVTLKHGRKSGLLPEMELHVFDPAYVAEKIELTRVEEEQSEGVITRYTVNGWIGLVSLLLDRNPVVGWRLSTRRP